MYNMRKLLTILFLCALTQSFAQTWTGLDIKPNYKNGLKVGGGAFVLPRKFGAIVTPVDTAPHLIVNDNTLLFWNGAAYEDLKGGSNNYYSNGSSARQFIDTIKYFSNGSLTDIMFYMGRKTVANIRTMTDNGSGFLPTSGMNGDSVHVKYPISPYDTVWYIFQGSYADTNVLTPPNTLIATPLSATKMLLTFGNVPHNNGYEVYYGFTGGEYQYAATLDKDDTSYEHSGLPPDTRVFWEVRALGDTSYYGSNFSYTSARTEALVPIQTPSITATANSTSQITIHVVPSAHSTGTAIIYSTDGIYYTGLDTLSSSTTTYIHDSLSSGTQIWYKAQGLGDDSVYGSSAYSDTVSATTFTLPAVATPNLIIDSTQTTSVFMHWNPITGATAYLIQYSEDNLTWLLATRTTSLSFVHTGLTPNKKYYYQAQALGDSSTTNNSGFDLDSATTQPQVTQPTELPTPILSGTPISSSQIRANWNTVANATGFKLERSTNGATWILAANLSPGITQYVINSLQPATTYQLRITALGNGTIFLDSKFGTASATTFDTSTSTDIVHGVMLNGSNVNAAKIGLNNLGVSVVRTAYDGKGANYTAYTDQFKTLWNYNPSRPGDGLPMPTDSAQFACTLDSMLTENGTHNLIGIAIINEPVNVGYWTDNISASNYLKLLQACVNVGRRRGIAVYDGGISGNLKLYEVWWDFVQRGLKDSADNFAALAFDPETNLNNWRTSSNFGPRIRFLDTLIAGLKNIATDAVNLHYYETIRDVDSNKTSVSEEALLETVRYYSRATGKPVITNEYGLNNNNSIGVQTGLLKALKAAHVKIALYYGPDILTNPDGSLTPLGQNYKNTIAQP
jgi:hypothetical protein